MPGVTDQGFDPKTSEDIRREFESSQHSLISPEWEVELDSPTGQLNHIIADHEAQVWEALSELATAMDPDAAGGRFLDNIASITKTFRNGETHSLVTLEMVVAPGQTIAAGELFSGTSDGSPQWASLAAVTNSGGANATFSVAAEAIDPGPVEAAQGTITVAVDSPTGLISVTNPEDASLGSGVETDAALRTRREVELGSLGKSYLDAIRAALLKLDGMESVSVFENTSILEVNGTAPFSIEAVIFDGTVPAVANDDIAQALRDTIAGGTPTDGSDSGNALNSEGKSFEMFFSRAESLDVWVEIDIRRGAGFPATGAALIAQAVAEWGDANLGVGSELVVSRLCSPIFSVAGVDDIVEVRVGLSASPTNTSNLVVNSRQVVDLDTGRITVNLV